MSFSENIGLLALMKGFIELIIIIVIIKYYSYGYIKNVIGSFVYPGLLVLMALVFNAGLS